MNNTSQKLSVLEKVGYSLGDFAANLIFQTLMTFLAFFYTDVYKIPAGTASAIIFFGGFIGAFFNIIMGAVADRTRTRWGKFRPWILWTSLPFGIIAILAFSTPDFGPDGKVIYALVTYFLLILVYSANNLPYSALSGVLTGDMGQRNSLSSYRFVAVMFAQFIIQGLLLPLVLILGHGDKAAGFKTTMMIFAIAGVICFIITFLTTKERIVPKKEQESSVKQDLLDLSKNKPWVIMLFVTILIFVTLSLKGGMYIYYFKYYLDPVAQATFLQDIGFNNMIAGLNDSLIGMGLTEFQWPKDAPTSAFSLFNSGGILFMIFGIMFSKGLADKFGKRNIFIAFIFLSALSLVQFNFYAPTSITLVFVTQIVHGFLYGITIPLLWAMIADVADYSEWKNNRRATAIIFSAMIFGLKVGLSIGGALGAFLLSRYGYVAEAANQAQSAIAGIKLAVSVYPGLFFIASAGLVCFYMIDKKMEVQLESELKERRSKNIN
ncbi:Na+/melibiose symporter-like transporter [Flavobacterium sp. 28A]|uniref:MFS transporter n=1 Tax=Flavobacterium sp. 28A TaxID=2735895 RepID=UPI0015705A93|nr:MFS transporter [Flavobacterium sp. 28A]NRT16418.1 Na+/melibiose symporter-like transporter [Flavobacterium sp. 28A]